MATYLVAGGAGFIGSHIVDELVRRGQRVRVLDNFSIDRPRSWCVGRNCVQCVCKDF
jgi:nucleoside-diphosphate-sugar epimerase